METEIIKLFEKHFGAQITEIRALPKSGSARCYFRLYTKNDSYIGVYNQNVEENLLFIRFSGHFESQGLHAPRIHCVSENNLFYIQEDLGESMLLDVLEKERQAGGCLNGHLINLYQKSLSELLRFQLLGGEGLDYSKCMPRPVFDRQCIMWDLNYFKYCFLRLTGVDFSEQQLEDDFIRLANTIEQEQADRFLFRDFQSRNIMVKGDDVFFIDYQGGRKGALHYDVASLLYDAIAEIPDVQREELLSYYIDSLQVYLPVDGLHFRDVYYHFVLVRLLQAMGAFGLRGLHEGKQHFIDSIIPGLQNILSLFVENKLRGQYPAIEDICRKVLLQRNTL